MIWFDRTIKWKQSLKTPIKMKTKCTSWTLVYYVRCIHTHTHKGIAKTTKAKGKLYENQNDNIENANEIVSIFIVRTLLDFKQSSSIQIKFIPDALAEAQAKKLQSNSYIYLLAIKYIQPLNFIVVHCICHKTWVVLNLFQNGKKWVSKWEKRK